MVRRPARLRPGVGGLITSGGSIANLIALTAARDRFLGGAARADGLQGRASLLTVYTSEDVHSSTDKAVSILGIGTRWLRRLPCDDQVRIRLDLLAKAVAEDRANGASPFCVVASAGTVTTGAIDPRRELAAFCQMADLALFMGDLAGRREEFELLAPVVFNCVCFRLAGLDAAGNRAVLKRLVDGGTAFLGPASVKGRIGLRACFMNLRTTRTDVELIMDEIARLGKEVAG